MTLYADDPDVHVVFPVTDREGQNITISPATVMVDGFSDITATWLGDPAPVRNLKVPLYGLPPMVELKLRLVVPGDNDVPLTAKTGGVILRSSSTDREWPGQPGVEYYTKAEIDVLLANLSGGSNGSGDFTVVSGGTVELNDDLPRGTLLGYDVTTTTTFTTEAGSVVLTPGLWSLRRSGIGWNWKELPAGTAITAPIEGPDISDDFNATNTVSINGRVTPVGSKAWVTPWVAGLGGDPLSITSNRVGVSSVGGAGRLLTDQQNYRASAVYDVTETSKQTRVYARAQASATNDSATSGVCVVLRGNGDLNVERGNDYFGVGQIGAGQPATGILSIEVVGDTGKAFVNGVQVGATFSVAGINGAYAGLGFYAGGTADDFTIEYL